MKTEALNLADSLDVESSQAEYGYVVDDWRLFSDSADMIRKLVAELDKQGEPVAWISPMTLKNLQTPFLSQVTHKVGIKANTMNEFTLPLYTTPQTKLLSDDAIDALKDALNGWKYIRECHGDLYGVGWDRVQDKLERILGK